MAGLTQTPLTSTPGASGLVEELGHDTSLSSWAPATFRLGHF